jgi:hypothetical protein
MKSYKVALSLTVASMLTVGCAAVADDSDPDEALLHAEEALTTQCGQSRAALLAAASGSRRQAMERGFDWLDQKVPYSQARTHEGYRTDCSGFVSMCWETGTSYTTASYVSGTANSRLASFDELDPADALVRSGHMMMFLGWSDKARSAACVLELASTASDMQFRARTTASLRSGGYRAIRSDAMQ